MVGMDNLLKNKCNQCEKSFTSDKDLKIHMDNAHLEEDDTGNIAQPDGNDEIEKPKKNNAKEEIIPTFKFVSDMTEEEREAHEKKQEEEAKSDGSWCYECNDLCLNKIVLKRHMHNDHHMEIYPEINIMLHGGWMQ